MGGEGGFKKCGILVMGDDFERGGWYPFTDYFPRQREFPVVKYKSKMIPILVICNSNNS